MQTNDTVAPADHDAVGQAELVRTKQVSATELVEAAIARIEDDNPFLNAVIGERFERARAEAAGPLPDGPFRGVPFLVKDLGLMMAGEPVYAGTRALRAIDHRAAADSALAQRFRAAGLIVLGRTNTPEFGNVITTEPASFGPTRNPWDPTRSPGGSSGGSAAAVAAGFVAAAHASDGGGSIRIPAAACGLIGLKPSRGRVSTAPGFDSWAAAVTDGVVTRTVRDTAAMLDVMAGYECGDPFIAPPPARRFADEVGVAPGRLRVGMLDRPPAADLARDPHCADAVAVAARILESLGHSVEPAFPAALHEYDQQAKHFANVVAASTAQEVARVETLIGRTAGEDDLEPDDLKLASWGRALTASDYLASVEWLRSWSRRVVQWWDGFDLLLTPTLGAPPAELGYLAGPGAGRRMRPWFQYTAQFNITGQPAISLPLHRTGENLPIGVQLVASPWREDLLIRVASQIEASIGAMTQRWHRR